jgi:hypothetical protein
MFLGVGNLGFVSIFLGVRNLGVAGKRSIMVQHCITNAATEHF